jgi:hypothetical protein
VQIGIVYKADGTIREIRRQQKGHSFSLVELQGAVGCFIERLRMAPGNGHAMTLVNERGKLLDLPPNAQASALLHPIYADRVVGDAIVLKHRRARKGAQYTPHRFVSQPHGHKRFLDRGVWGLPGS